MTPIEPAQHAAPYGSARDLPSYQELARQIQGGKLLTLFIARNQRSRFLEIERQLDHLVAVVDRFYDRLGSRNWIFHELLPISNVETILDQTATSEEAEQRLIEIYRDEEKLGLWTRRLFSVEGLRERSHQIERALGHYFAGHFDSAAFHLIAVMDGFVNDFEPDRRHSLASREPDAMTAWDNVVGHHLGLTNALKSIRQDYQEEGRRGGLRVVPPRDSPRHDHAIRQCGRRHKSMEPRPLPRCFPPTCSSQLSTGRRLPKRPNSRRLLSQRSGG